MSDIPALYESMTKDQLIARLKVAEDTLTLIGWCSTDLGSMPGVDRSDAGCQMWIMWATMVGGDFTDPENHAALDAMVPELAAQRRRTVKETLARFFGEES